MSSKGRHRDNELLRQRPAPRSSITEPSERLRAQPSILHYKSRNRSISTRTNAARSVPVQIFEAAKKRKLSRAARCSVYSSQHPGVHISRAGAHTLENHKETRQPKPNPRELLPLRVPVKKSIEVQPSCCPRDSGSPTDSSALLKHTRDIDWRCSQSHCNPDKDTHWRGGSAGASGTNQHRPIFLKRWKACLSPGVLGICRAKCTRHVLIKGCPRMSQRCSPLK